MGNQPSWDYQPFDELGDDSSPGVISQGGQKLPPAPTKVPIKHPPKLGPAIELATPRPPIGTLANRRDEGIPRAFLLQKWITVRGTSPITSITQQDSLWHDLSTYADAAFWVEVSEVTAPGSGTVSLILESSPTWDEANFKPIAPPLVLSPSTVPYIVRCVRTLSTVPLSRWTRWRLQASTSGTWDATMRIRGTAGFSSFIIPTTIKNCFCWLRADLGVTKSGNSVTSWADQSGVGNDCVSAGFPPTFNANPIAGQPTISFDPNLTQYLQFTGAGSPTAAHAFIIHRRSSATETVLARTGFWKMAAGNAAQMPNILPDNQIYDDAFSTTPKTCGQPVIPPASLAVPHIYEVVADTTSWMNLLNGNPQFSASHTFNYNGMGYIGGNPNVGHYYPGDWAEMVLYSRILKGAERSLLIDYFNGRYGLSAV